MINVKKTSFGRMGTRRSVALLATLAATIASPTAFGAVVCSAANLGISVQTTNINGLYYNFVTGINNTAANGAGATVPGWDFNVYSSSGTSTGNVSFFTSTAAANTNRVVGTGTIASVLASGTPIDAASTLTTAGVVGGGGFLAGVVNGYVGIAFRNEATAATNYGWAALTTTAGTGFPATLNRFCYQNDGTGITAGTTPVELQNYSID